MIYRRYSGSENSRFRPGEVHGGNNQLGLHHLGPSTSGCMVILTSLQPSRKVIPTSVVSAGEWIWVFPETVAILARHLPNNQADYCWRSGPRPPKPQRLCSHWGLISCKTFFSTLPHQAIAFTWSLRPGERAIAVIDFTEG